MIINEREISEAHPPYIVAEIGAGHNGTLESAQKLIRSASESEASAVKIQVYTPEEMTIDSKSLDFKVKGGIWQGHTFHNLYQVARTPFEWVPELIKTAKEYNITLFASVFGMQSLEFMESLECPAYKIASFEAVHYELIEAVARTDKPVIVSTGMLSDWELFKLQDYFESCDKTAFLHCVSGYPTKLAEARLGRIPTLQSIFPEAQIGFSDHTIGNEAALVALGMGATIFEKHIAMAGSEDSEFAMRPYELDSYVEELTSAWQAKQESTSEAELWSKQFRRSIYVVKDVKEGDTLTSDNIAVIRPGFGMHPSFLPKVLGRKALCDAAAGSVLAMYMVDTNG